MIESLSHVTFIVKDLDRTSELFKSIFDAQEIYSSEEKTFSLSREKFFLIAGQWIVLMEGNSLSERTYHHLAFKIKEAEFEIYRKKLNDLDVELGESRSRVDGEGQSLYFYDFDNHLFELHTGTLPERLKRYKKTKRDDK